MAYSKRQFRVFGLEGNNLVNHTIGLNQLFEDDDGTEVLYSLQEKLDDILDMQVDEMMFVELSRDNPNCKGVIKRIN